MGRSQHMLGTGGLLEMCRVKTSDLLVQTSQLWRSHADGVKLHTGILQRGQIQGADFRPRPSRSHKGAYCEWPMADMKLAAASRLLAGMASVCLFLDWGARDEPQQRQCCSALCQCSAHWSLQPKISVCELASSRHCCAQYSCPATDEANWSACRPGYLQVFWAVMERGGYEAVTASKQWKEICRCLPVDLTGALARVFHSLPPPDALLPCISSTLVSGLSLSHCRSDFGVLQHAPELRALPAGI